MFHVIRNIVPYQLERCSIRHGTGVPTNCNAPISLKLDYQRKTNAPPTLLLWWTNYQDIPCLHFAFSSSAVSSETSHLNEPNCFFLVYACYSDTLNVALNRK